MEYYFDKSTLTIYLIIMFYHIFELLLKERKKMRGEGRDMYKMRQINFFIKRDMYGGVFNISRLSIVLRHLGHY